jgi:hypothetical protein
MNSNGTAKILHCFRQRLHLIPKEMVEHYKPDVKGLPGRGPAQVPPGLVRYSDA